MREHLLEFVLALGLFVLLSVSWFVGKRIGRRIQADLVAHPQLGTVQGAILALLGLLLGFAFAGSTSRFVGRQDLIVREANSISTLYERADLLAPEQRDELKGTLREYTTERLALMQLQALHEDQHIQDRLNGLLRDAWTTVRAGVEARPQFASLLVPACNEVGDTLMERNAENERHLPLLVIIVLFACAFSSIAAIGLGVETTDRRLRAPAAVLVFLIAATLWVTIDLDFPRLGFAKVNGAPLVRVLHSMSAAPAG